MMNEFQVRDQTNLEKKSMSCHGLEQRSKVQTFLVTLLSAAISLITAVETNIAMKLQVESLMSGIDKSSLWRREEAKSMSTKRRKATAIC